MKSTTVIQLPTNKRYHAIYINGEQIPPEKMKITVDGQVIWEGEEFRKSAERIFGDENN